MNTPYHLRTPEFQPNIPLLDSEFDSKSPEIDDFILFHTRMQNEDFDIMVFDKNPENKNNEKAKKYKNPSRLR